MVIEHSQGDKSSPCWKAIRKDPLKFVTTASIPEGGFDFAKPSEADQGPLNRALLHWSTHRLVFKNLNAMTTGVDMDLDNEQAPQSRKRRKGRYEDVDDEDFSHSEQMSAYFTVC